MERAMYSAKDLAELLGVSQTKSYEYIRVMNSELSKDGFLTVRGKVPKAYAEKRFFGMVSAS